MKRRLLLQTVLALLTVLSLSRASAASPGAARGDADSRPIGAIDRALLRQASGPAKVVLELADAPTAKAYADARARGLTTQATADAQRQLARVESAQQRLLAPLAQLDAKLIYRVQRVYNGIAVLVDSGKLDALARLPGVKALHPLITKRLDNSSSVPLIGAPQLWSATSPISGTNIKLGIIDTGIDYIHTDFGGTGSPADYARNNTTTTAETGLFPNAKVVGGQDFAGDDYDADSPATSIPHPDPDPIDCAFSAGGGHGSHVAGSAAGLGVKLDGTTYTGPYDAGTNFSALRIGPGVAPGAKLYALRIFGCAGTTDLADEALEWAADPNGDGDFTDHLDVVNMSLGSSFGGTTDSTSVAAENAVEAGVIVVASAGNSADTNYITGSPGSSDSVISVASSVDSGTTSQAIRVNSPAVIAGNYLAIPGSNNPPLTTTGVTGDVVYAQPADGCAALTNAAAIGGKVALIDRGTCSFTVKVKNAQDAGAIAVIVANNNPDAPVTMDLSTITVTVPALMISQSDGATIKGQLPGVNITIAEGLTVTVSDPAQTDTVSDFSSRGPRRGGVLKPDISAPGETIFSAKSGSGSFGVVESGTSMAAPHVAGAMALLKQLHPNWTVAQLKALAMNTADKDLRSANDPNAQIYGPARVGAGRVDLPNAAAQSVIAFDKASPNLVSLSFGTLEVTGTTTLSKQVTVLNKGTSGATFNLAYAPISTIPGVSYSVTPASLTLGASESKDVTVTLTADASTMKHTHDPTLSESQALDARHWVSEASGYLTLTPPAENANFTAAIHGYYENPPVDTSYSAIGTFVYTNSTNMLGYDISFSSAITLTAGHIHVGAAGINGPNPYTLSSGGTGITHLTGSVTLTAPEEGLLLGGGLYVNFHTSAHQGGELRGQIVPASPPLRLPIYAAARPAAQMRAQASKLALSTPTIPSATTAITLTGAGLTGAAPPLDERSLVSTFELQHVSPQIVPPSLVTSTADLRYVGVTSTYTSSTTISDTEIYFGVATYRDWATPSEVEFDVYIDTNLDGVDDYALLNTSAQEGGELTDVFISRLVRLSGGQTIDQDYINAVAAADLDTAPFNTNILVIPVLSSDLGLTAGASRFRYHVIVFSNDQSNAVDRTPRLTYDIAKPGVRFSGGIGGLPLFPDAPGGVIPVAYNRAYLFANVSQGVLLLHHHNLSGTRAEVVWAPSFVALPLVGR